MKIVFNPKYKELLPFLEEIDRFFEKEGDLIYDGRNQLKRYQYKGIDFIVKSFKVPIFFNRVVYSFFRPSKARRSYEYALKYLERGVSTPEPIAYVEQKSFGILKHSYAVSLYAEGFSEIRKEMLNIDCDEKFIKALAAFIAKIQNEGIFQNDLSPGNILSKREAGRKVQFTLVDINRTKFIDKMSLELRCENFRRISEDKDVIESLAKEYARLLSLDEKRVLGKINNAIAGYSKKYKMILKRTQ